MQQVLLVFPRFDGGLLRAAHGAHTRAPTYTSTGALLHDQGEILRLTSTLGAGGDGNRVGAGRGAGGASA